MRKWLKKHKIPYDEIWQREGPPNPDIFIDYNVVKFMGGWIGVLMQVTRLLDDTNKTAVKLGGEQTQSNPTIIIVLPGLFR
jgi:hypothetical protein